MVSNRGVYCLLVVRQHRYVGRQAVPLQPSVQQEAQIRALVSYYSAQI